MMGGAMIVRRAGEEPQKTAREAYQPSWEVRVMISSCSSLPRSTK